MADLQILEGLDGDERQELKEAVCDAVLERTRRVVSGAGEHGRIVLRERPSRTLSSGFILPRLTLDGDDASSDIRIATHGMDLRVRTHAHGAVRVQPTFAVYMRALPTSEELFARNGRLVPPAGFSPSAKARLRDEIRQRMAAVPSSASRAERAAARERIVREVMSGMGVQVPQNAIPTAIAGDPEDSSSLGDLSRTDTRTRLRIPNAVSRTYGTPEKWVRITVETPSLVLEFPLDPQRWGAATADYSRKLLDATRKACADWIRSPEGLAFAWRAGNIPSEAFWSPGAWDQQLAILRSRAPDPSRLIPPLEFQLLVDAVADPLDRAIASVRIALENLREHDDSLECGLFGLSLRVDIPDEALVPMRLERVRRSYHLAGFLTMPGVGVNGGIEDLAVRDGIRELRTTWMPRYVLPRMTTATLEAVPTNYARLADEALDVSIVDALPREMSTWVDMTEAETRLFWPGEEGTEEDERIQQARFREDLTAWRREAARVKKGIDLLSRSQRAYKANPQSEAAIPYRAWLLLNRTFQVASSDPSAGWRLFQLAFVLAHVPTLASRVPTYTSDFDADFDEDAASLLYMSTGGGKTEAFFGTVVYALFLDRLRGKQRGVTAMMHYPLRLLTIQQAQRLGRLLARAEMVRRGSRVPGSPFEIGFWVGGANTPNRTEKDGRPAPDVSMVPSIATTPLSEEDRLTDPRRGDKAYIAARDAWNKLPACPFCDTATALRLFPDAHHQLGIACPQRTCWWNTSNGTDERTPSPLPFVLTDSDIYNRAPAVLLGTVDKLALLGQNTYTINAIAGMFGMARYVEGGAEGCLRSPDRDLDTPLAGHERLAPSWAGGREVFFDPFPSLIIQDEMHLLDESLGTFGGVFETALLTWFAELARLLGQRVIRVPGAPDEPRLPHLVGATATAADAAKHVAALYQRRVVQFPHPGPSLLNGFYVRLASFSRTSAASAARTGRTEGTDIHPRLKEASAPWARIYASLMTNGRLHTVTTLSVLAAHASTITRWLKDLASEDLSRRARAASELSDNISEAPWADRRRAAVERQAQSGRHDRLAALVDLHRIALTYVTNKKGGDQILSAITAEVDEAHEAMGPEYALPDFPMALISGGVDVKGIQSVIRMAQQRFEPAVDEIGGALRGIVATSAISHGVDVETFNAMAFAGMPSDIAEYIQASSRVGRTHVGFSLLIPTPQARRDRFIVGVHESFHRLLERMIAPPAVERWAERALERTIPSLFQLWLAGVLYQRRIVEADADAKSRVRFPGTVEAVASLFTDAGGPERFEQCVAFVQRAIGVESVNGGAGNSAAYYRNLVRDGVKQIRAEICSGNIPGRLSDFWRNEFNPLRRRQPMTSLRDVDEAGIIQASRTSTRSRGVDLDELAAAMAFIRNRGVTRGRPAPSSEVDTEEEV
ncbi:MAG TPA: DEAD/DEAH box helicase family protein [Polyangia bacterium]|nr:DEAD/DEAH box helicase family protein [Polyangia bacterium]